MEMRRSDLSQDAPALTDLVATLLGNVFKTLLKKSLHFDPVGKTKQSRSMVRTYSFARTLLISSTLCCVVLWCVVLFCIVLCRILPYHVVPCCAVQIQGSVIYLILLCSVYITFLCTSLIYRTVTDFLFFYFLLTRVNF